MRAFNRKKTQKVPRAKTDEQLGSSAALFLERQHLFLGLCRHVTKAFVNSFMAEGNQEVFFTAASQQGATSSLLKTQFEK